MLHSLFEYLNELDVPGAGVFQYISFRASMALIFSIIISAIIGKKIIHILQRKQVGETIRDLGLEGQMQKKGTPTMGGIIILAAIIIPTLLFAKLSNIYIILMLITTVWLGTIGFIDDYIKVYKKNKKGLAGRFKVFGQVSLGLIVGITMYLHPDIVVRQQVPASPVEININHTNTPPQNIKSSQTTVPLIKNNNFNYSSLTKSFGAYAEVAGWVVFILATIFIITATSNGANLTDGLDGLATGTSAIVGVTLGIFAYVSGHVQFAEYLNIMYIPHSEELVIFIAAFIGSTIGFLWYNAFPAQVFMGDTGSLALGGIIAVFAIVIHKELLLPILCGVFLIESLSTIIQVTYFKYTKKRFGEGRRVFLMTPIHHHFQKKNIPESKIVSRFLIVGIALAMITIVTLKLR